jgi:hypothetical protein
MPASENDARIMALGHGIPAVLGVRRNGGRSENRQHEPTAQTNFKEAPMSKQGEAEYRKWAYAEFPYDEAECYFCATAHRRKDRSGCMVPHHAEMRKAAAALEIGGDEIFAHPRRSRRLILAFRKKFARFYPRGK